MSDIKTGISTEGDIAALSAIACTCRDFALNAQEDDGSAGGSFYGCAHMIFYNRCRTEAASGTAGVITE